MTHSVITLCTSHHRANDPLAAQLPHHVTVTAHTPLLPIPLQREIEKVRQQREERERAKADAEEALTLLNRERAVAEAMEAEAKEDEFHLEQLQVGCCWGTCTHERCCLLEWRRGVFLGEFKGTLTRFLKQLLRLL